ncbi:creatininase family protein [Rugamonas sp.]|uniref:creatininase family protein n=1 Tax=Rugamonas sp. TaxID=1926287 RepID=UPI0025F64DCF|nr:creatininase family protein [Rugamonas sp.]
MTFDPTFRLRLFSLVVAALLFASPAPFAAAAAARPDSVYLEDLSWPEVGAALRAGKTTIIIPVGGTEQSGPHMALGKHNARATALAGKIAAMLGNALVAPTLAYVPEGSVTPPAGHMRYTGTISIPDEAFKGLLDGAARSFKQHGFVDVVLIGDHGGYQAQLKAVAARLNHDWAGTPARAHFIAEYYQAADVDFVRALRARGLTAEQIGLHAGTADTSLTLALAPALVRMDQLPADARQGRAAGVNGDPRAASAALGQLGVDLMVNKTVAAIRAAQQR